MKPHKSFWEKGSSFVVGHFTHLFKSTSSDASSLSMSQTRADVEFNSALQAFKARLDSHDAADIKQLIEEFVEWFNDLEDEALLSNPELLKHQKRGTDSPKPAAPNSDKALDTGESDSWKLARVQELRGLMFQGFTASLYNALEHHIAWKTVTDKSELELLPECIEEYITLSISQKLYVPAKEEDWIFSSFITSIGFITPDHLDLDMTIEDVLLLSCGQNLADMNFAASPRAKLVCIADCCVKIFNYLELVKADKSGVTADDFLPVLILVITKANPPMLLSNLKFISACRTSDSLVMSEWGYFFTHVELAVNFLRQFDPTKLSLTPIAISKEEIVNDWIMLPNSEPNKLKYLEKQSELVEKHRGISLKLNQEKFQKLMRDIESSIKKERGVDFLPRRAPPERVKAAVQSLTNGERTVSMASDKERFFERYPLWTKSAAELKPDEIASLLTEYKRLALSEWQQLEAPPKHPKK